MAHSLQEFKSLVL